MQRAAIGSVSVAPRLVAAGLRTCQARSGNARLIAEQKSAGVGSATISDD